MKPRGDIGRTHPGAKTCLPEAGRLLLLLVVLLADCTSTSITPAPQDTASVGAAYVMDPDQPPTFRRLTLEDGLSQSSIACIAQDELGLMWFGTQDGMNRYDGYEFEVYRHDPDDPYSLSDNYVLGCERDQRGVLWVITRDGTLHRYVTAADHFVRYTLALEDPLQRGANRFTVMHGDSQGRLWIGTVGDGLVRYDPETDGIVYYRHDPGDPVSLSHRVVFHVIEDKAGDIWVGTEAGLNRYDPVSDSFVRYPYRDFPPGGYRIDGPARDDDPAFQPNNPFALASPAALFLLEDRGGRLWVGTRYGGLNYLDRETGHFTAMPFDPSHTPEDPGTLSGNAVRTLLEDHEGYIWVSSAHWNVDGTRTYARLGLERIDPETGEIVRFPSDPEEPCSPSHQAMMTMIEDRRGTLWFHTFAGGVDIYDRSTDCFVHYGHDAGNQRTLSGDDITRFYEDEAGGLWIGTAASGISYYDPSVVKFPVYRVDVPGDERMSNNSVWSMAPSPSRVDADGRVQAMWISTFAGLNYWDRRTNTFTFYEIDPQLPDNLAYAVYEDAARQTLWLGTSMGLERASLPDGEDAALGPLAAPATLKFTRVLTRSDIATGPVLDIHPAGEGQVWLARHAVGLSLFDLASEQVVLTYRHNPDDDNSLDDERVTGIYPGRAGTLWLVTMSGVEHFDPATERFTHYRHDPGDVQGVAARILMLYQDDAGRVWLGTDGVGLQQLDPAAGRVVATYSVDQGLPNNVVYGILPDNSGGLWLSTNKGLARFDPAAGTFRNYTSQDGLQSNEFNYLAAYRAADGELFFGGVSGFNAFYPYRIVSSAYVPPVIITDILLGPPKPSPAAGIPSSVAADAGDEMTLPTSPALVEQIELSYRDRILSFEFAALHYANPECNQYAYLLVGFDDEWHYAGNRRYATYTNLPPGRYTFRVKGTNSDGVWNEVGASVAVVVHPPFWATWWFQGMVVALVAGGIVAGYRVRVRAVEARSRELERQVAERTRELAAVNTISTVVSRSLDLNPVLADALHKTLEVVGVESGGIYLLDEPDGVLNLAAQQGLTAALADEIDGLKAGEGFSGRVVRSGEALVVEDVAQDARLTRGAVQAEGLHSLVVVPLQAKSRISGTLFAVTRSYRTFTERDVGLLTTIGNQIGVAVENAWLFEAEQRRAEQFRVISEVGRRTTSILSLDDLLNQIVVLIQESFDYDIVEIGLVEGEDLVFKAGVDRAAPQAFHPFHVKAGIEGITGLVVVTGEPLLAPDVSQDARFLQFSDTPTRSELVVPIKTKEEVVGVLNIQSVRLNAFDESDLAVMQALADQAATAIENARLYEQARRLAVVEERQRLARELHDSVTQALYGVTLYAEAAARQLGAGQTAPAAQHLHELRDTAQEALREMRLLIFELRPSVLEHDGLEMALRARLESVEERAGLGVSFQVTGEAPLPAGVEQGLYRIAQEALNNALKHACAHTISVSLDREDGRVILEIVDDGVGFDPEVAVNGGGLGLEGMMERAEQMGGQLVVDSKPGGGTRVHVEVSR